MADTTCSSPRRWTYDVFLSFRGEDTRKTFTDHLYFALKDAGIITFRDDNELRRGEQIDTELLNAIQKSRISLVVFSRNYANSKWCLDELSTIMECRKSIQQWVMPIFYDVDPSDVREQTGSFGEAFARHEKRFATKMDMVGRWRNALTEAGSLDGWDMRHTAYGHEAKMMRTIVERILTELQHTYLSIAIHPVGIDIRLQRLISLLKMDCTNDVRIVGICGMGGLGKTTIAKAVYNQFFHSFEGKSFLANVKETSKQPDGRIRLQEQLLSDILKVKKLKVRNVDRGITIIKERLRNKRILIVVDDVDQLDQLNIIASMHKWFCSGSRIIITTRDEHLLKQIKVDEVYVLKEMDAKESLELFSWYAFRNIRPTENYVELSKNVVNYCQGIPLALEVLGSFLFDRSVLEWESALEKLKRIPNDQIQTKLRISFDELGDDTEKSIFLDIACFFIGMKKDYAVQILDSFGFFSEIGISVLTRRCLLTIDEKNELAMHDLLRDMGREVVREESPKNPGKRSRLWFYEDALNVLTKQTGTEAVEGLVLRRLADEVLHMSTESFAKMSKVRLLKLDSVNVSGSYGHLSKELRWLCWHKFHLKFIPDDFNMENLMTIDMRYSNLSQLWKDGRFLENLKVLNLSHSPYLTTTPDFLKLPNLEKLMMKDCTSLTRVDQSIGELDKLIVLKIKGCKSLMNLPRNICRLKYLEILDISSCSRIEELPDNLGEMESLAELFADGTSIRQVPISILQLSNLRKLSLCGCKATSSSSITSLFWSWISTRSNLSYRSLLPSSIVGLSSLTTLRLTSCNLSYDDIPKDIGCLSALVDLDLRQNSFHSLPDSLSNLTNLKLLQLDGCAKLQSLPKLPTSLSTFYATECTSLEKMSSLSKMSYLQGFFVTNCKKLVEIPGLDNSTCGLINMEGCNNLSSSFKHSLIKDWTGNGHAGVFLPGSEIPSWFSHQSIGSSLSFLMPQRSKTAFIICIMYAAEMDNNVAEAFPRITVRDKTKDLEWTYRPTTYGITSEDQILVVHLADYVFRNQIAGGDEMELTVEIDDGLIVKKCAIQVCDQDGEFYNPSDSPEMIEHYPEFNTKRGLVYDDPDDGEDYSEPKRARYK